MGVSRLGYQHTGEQALPLLLPHVGRADEQAPEQHTSKNETTLETSSVKITITYDGCPRLQWFSKDKTGHVESETPFLADSRSRAYAYEAVEGGVLHYVSRGIEALSSAR
jgi:hypothetical protein